MGIFCRTFSCDVSTARVYLQSAARGTAGGVSRRPHLETSCLDGDDQDTHSRNNATARAHHSGAAGFEEGGVERHHDVQGEEARDDSVERVDSSGFRRVQPAAKE